MSETLVGTSERDAVDVNPLLEGLRTTRTPAPCALVIFGATGDLTHRKLLPGLYALASEGSLPAGFTVIGAARTAMSPDAFRAAMREAVERHGRVPVHEEIWGSFAAGLTFVTYDLQRKGGMAALRAALEAADRDRGTGGNRVYYFSVPPSAVLPLSDRLRSAHLSREVAGGFVRIIVEKPFGRNLDTARELNHRLHEAFREDQ